MTEWSIDGGWRDWRSEADEWQIDIHTGPGRRVWLGAMDFTRQFLSQPGAQGRRNTRGPGRRSRFQGRGTPQARHGQGRPEWPGRPSRPMHLRRSRTWRNAGSGPPCWKETCSSRKSSAPRERRRDWLPIFPRGCAPSPSTSRNNRASRDSFCRVIMLTSSGTMPTRRTISSRDHPAKRAGTGGRPVVHATRGTVGSVAYGDPGLEAVGSRRPGGGARPRHAVPGVAGRQRPRPRFATGPQAERRSRAEKRLKLELEQRSRLEEELRRLRELWRPRSRRSPRRPKTRKPPGSRRSIAARKLRNGSGPIRPPSRSWIPPSPLRFPTVRLGRQIVASGAKRTAGGEQGDQ